MKRMSIYPKNIIAVIFSAQRNDMDPQGYDEAAAAMVKLAKQQEGFLGIDSSRDQNGYGITISYWRNEEAAKAWRDNEQHSAIRDKGRNIWYDHYSLQVATIKRSYDWKKRVPNSE